MQINRKDVHVNMRIQPLEQEMARRRAKKPNGNYICCCNDHCSDRWNWWSNPSNSKYL